MALGVEGVSVVTTTFNEREYVGVFVERVRGALRGVRHEVVVVDDSSPDGTYLEAARWADRAVLVRGAGQTGGLAVGLGVARYPVVVTLDVDLENPPELIPVLLREFAGRGLDLLVASRAWLPRFSERVASATVGRVVGVGDVFSNFRVYRRGLFAGFRPVLGETFGGELLAYAWARGFRLGELVYEPPPRRARPRIGGRVRANARILAATGKLLLYLASQGAPRARLARVVVRGPWPRLF
ncbi:glycosyltransferase [Infirmifilum sp. NZ]|uniref:glycosyltransferase n=1 Tax=Infirmifilum sp. NZ TaxID=2926850 RepID=UPI00279B623C|nr:glycosyltransferase [Infirmifilum sp. NZ]UNQ73161.1 glycosyltransferase [Infirmifilum sp. NZ]